MGLGKRVYNVLIVSGTDNFNTTLTSMLPESRYDPVRIVTSINAAKRSVAECEFDLIIVNSPLPDDTGIGFAIDMSHLPGTVVLLLIRSELHDEIYDKVSVHGVFTMPKPTSKSAVLTALGWMSSVRERLRKFEKKTLSIEEKMAEIRIINKAKWILIGELKMDEPEAHRYIEKQAMDRCVTKREVAEDIIKTYT